MFPTWPQPVTTHPWVDLTPRIPHPQIREVIALLSATLVVRRHEHVASTIAPVALPARKEARGTELAHERRHRRHQSLIAWIHRSTQSFGFGQCSRQSFAFASHGFARAMRSRCSGSRIFAGSDTR